MSELLYSGLKAIEQRLGNIELLLGNFLQASSRPVEVVPPTFSNPTPATPPDPADSTAASMSAQVVSSEIKWSGDDAQDVILAAKALAAKLGGNPRQYVLDASTFTDDAGKKVPGFSDPRPKQEQAKAKGQKTSKWVVSTLNRLKKQLSDAGFAGIVTGALPF